VSSETLGNVRGARVGINPSSGGVSCVFGFRTWFTGLADRHWWRWASHADGVGVFCDGARYGFSLLRKMVPSSRCEHTGYLLRFGDFFLGYILGISCWWHTMTI